MCHCEHADNSDLIACTVFFKDNTKIRRFLVIDYQQLILVEPVINRLGWGHVKLVGFLQDVEVLGDKDDSRCLHITIHRGGTAGTSATATKNRAPILSAKFVFADHIRCMAAKQRLTKGRSKARQKKMFQIAHMLEIPGAQLNDAVAAAASLYASASVSASGSSLSGGGGVGSGASSAARPSSIAARVTREHRPLFSTTQRAPGVASALRRSDASPSAGVSRMQMMSGQRGASVDSGSMGARLQPVAAAQLLRDTSLDRSVVVGSPASTSSSMAAKSRDSSRNRGSRECSPRVQQRPR